ncbi:hypothetical protein DKX38_029776 [Salix brachista]|uniref:ADP-ribosyl cyclase/cyclic ADP-ribose hydrolase n=1 Tax=Salix brachista TaxID=2182728 RepID=A0A5N5J007_9ROSI|nr:hypothetical protein DKX38_029776 [Salix brachista]
MQNYPASSSPPTLTNAQTQGKFDVFLSFRGDDTRAGFTSHLHAALERKQILTFIDYQLVRGDEISASLLRTIEESKLSVVVFSEKYASSKWCLEELAKIFECRKNNGQIVIPVFYQVDPSHVRNQTGSFGDEFARLVKKKPLTMDKVQSFKNALTDAANLAGWSLGKSEQELKTGSMADLQRSFLSQLLGHEILNMGSWIFRDTFVRDRLRRKKVFIVLDDVDDLMLLEEWKELLHGRNRSFGPGSKVLMTSRDKQVLNNVVDETYEVERLSYKEALQLFSSKALKNCIPTIYHRHLIEKIASHVQGNPLALIVLGSSLYGKSTEEWELRKLKAYLWTYPSIKEIPSSSYKHMMFLENLSLRGTLIKELPLSIKDMVCLSALSLDGTLIKTLPKLPPWLELLTTSHCESLETTMISTLTLGNLMEALNFANCFKLDQKPLIAAMHLKIKSREKFRRDQIQMILPGSEIPEWFGDKGIGSSLTIQLPSNCHQLKGIAFCLVFLLPLPSHDMLYATEYLRINLDSHVKNMCLRSHVRPEEEATYTACVDRVSPSYSLSSLSLPRSLRQAFHNRKRLSAFTLNECSNGWFKKVFPYPAIDSIRASYASSSRTVTA